MHTLPDALQHRKPDHDVDPIFLRRWSPRAMSGEPLTEAEIGSLFEAARWAPSSFNEQPWRFLYALRDTEHWPVFLDLLVEANHAWAQHAGMLVCVVSRRTFTRNGKPNPVHMYDAGAAWENFALQGALMGLAVHGMAGFNFNKARSVLAVPEEFDVAAMAAVGRPGDPSQLPEALQRGETPSGRKPVAEIALEGGFQARAG